ncbi:SPFH domain-containing protein [Cystobacter fuscus]
MHWRCGWAEAWSRPPPPRDEEWARDTEGWRAGKPAEDPEKMKKWGLITARPSEFLIHMRRGRVREVSGQGASCFKLPGDSVAIVPTSVQRLRFTADQVTSEKVGVQVTGLAVYRIVEPLVAFRMLNFSFPERAQEKLRELLTEMFVGAVRRLVANLSVEECLTRRKEGIATELMREISPVVSGRGRPEDRTDTGWGWCWTRLRFKTCGCCRRRCSRTCRRASGRSRSGWRARRSCPRSASSGGRRRRRSGRSPSRGW